MKNLRVITKPSNKHPHWSWGTVDDHTIAMIRVGQRAGVWGEATPQNTIYFKCSPDVSDKLLAMDFRIKRERGAMTSISRQEVVQMYVGSNLK